MWDRKAYAAVACFLLTGCVIASTSLLQVACTNIHETGLHMQVTFDRIGSYAFPAAEIHYEHC